jgi:hypothetical protein
VTAGDCREGKDRFENTAISCQLSAISNRKIKSEVLSAEARDGRRSTLMICVDPRSSAVELLLLNLLSLTADS